jgi:hypothetical protein
MVRVSSTTTAQSKILEFTKSIAAAESPLVGLIPRQGNEVRDVQRIPQEGAEAILGLLLLCLGYHDMHLAV